MNETTTSDDDEANFLAGFISEQDYALRRGVSIRTCQRDRQLRQSPPYVQLGNRIYYRVDAVRDWLMKNERETGFAAAATGSR